MGCVSIKKQQGVTLKANMPEELKTTPKVLNITKNE